MPDEMSLSRNGNPPILHTSRSYLSSTLLSFEKKRIQVEGSTPSQEILHLLYSLHLTVIIGMAPIPAKREKRIVGTSLKMYFDLPSTLRYIDSVAALAQTAEKCNVLGVKSIGWRHVNRECIG